MDKHGNQVRQDGVDRCPCGCKYWRNDRCIDCDGLWYLDETIHDREEITDDH